MRDLLDPKNPFYNGATEDAKADDGKTPLDKGSGKVYTYNPKDRPARMITVNTPDGGTAQFPDDTPQDAVVSAMKSKFGGPDASSSDDSALGQAGNFAYRAANTGTLHALDYGLAGVHTLTGGDDLATISSQKRGLRQQASGSGSGRGRRRLWRGPGQARDRRQAGGRRGWARG